MEFTTVDHYDCGLSKAAGDFVFDPPLREIGYPDTRVVLQLLEQLRQPIRVTSERKLGGSQPG
jgi:hypothetical protein